MANLFPPLPSPPLRAMQTVNGYSHDNKVSQPQKLQLLARCYRGELALLHCASFLPMLQTRGTYVSALGGLPLFSSQTKFNSGTG